MPAVQCDTSKLKVPERQATSTASASQNLLDEAKEQEENWLSHAQEVLVKEGPVQKGESITWSSYHADKERGSASTPGKSILLPLFSEKAASVAMVRHGMTIIKDITHYLNPGQVSVMTADQPLYALAKYVQWCWPDTLGEDHMTIIFGGLHTEMTIWKTIGDLLDGCGWATAMSDSEVTTTGRADACLKAQHLMKTRHICITSQHWHYPYSNTKHSRRWPMEKRHMQNGKPP